MTRIYLSNLGKYVEGILKGTWLTMPVTDEEIKDAFVKIGVGEYIDGEYSHGVVEDGLYVYEEYAIHDWETDIEGLKIGEYSSIENISELVELYANLSEHDKKKVNAICEWGYYQKNDLELAIENIEYFYLDENVTNDEEYGEFLLEDREDIPEDLRYYIDAEKLGRDSYINGNCYYSQHGLISH